jgi:alpha-L-arabinofuranosidase
MRQDIAQLLADMTPKFMRFPGGCLVHDGSINADDRNSMYRWKNTIGDIEQRPSRRNNWRYNQTLGLGYYEYFLFCEDIGAKPLPVLPAGYDPHHKRIVPVDELQLWIDDALDLIEFANGDRTTTWGAKRAELGHAEPFKLEYLAIGNEEVGEPFFERYTYFHNAIKQKYPEIKLINSSGPFAAGKEYERGWKSARENHSDMVDEHYYMSPEWFLANHHRYDSYKEDGPKVFLGEYASWGNAYYNALVEASYMIGLQNNAHAVALACYAPMLCNVDYTNWKPDMIWFNNNSCYGTPNYYVQKLFMNHQGDHLLTVNATGLDTATTLEKKNIEGSILLSCNKKEVEYSDIKLTNTDTAEEIVLKNVVLNDNNSLTELCKTDWQNYKLTLTAKEVKDKKDPQSQSGRGFKIFFGCKDDKNRLFWEVGGWQNQDSVVCADTNGRNACLTQSLFSVEADRAYPFELEITGRHIKTSIDHIIINETEDKLPVIEPLYYSASIENSTADVILKVANVQPSVVATEIVLADFKDKSISGNLYELSEHSAEDENSFSNPFNVKPKEREFAYSSNCFNYEFPKNSVTVFRIRQKA